MEHDEANGDVTQIDNGPAEILRHRRPGVDHNFGEEDEDWVNEPRAY